MTIGAVIFAQNNDIVDYIGLANHAASKIIKHLEIPVSLITNDRNLTMHTATKLSNQPQTIINSSSYAPYNLRSIGSYHNYLNDNYSLI